MLSSKHPQSWLATLLIILQLLVPDSSQASNTTVQLQELRALMQDSNYVNETIYAYIIPWKDVHNSEYLADCDKHRQFISGFSGSAGTALVTLNEAVLWTDGRYHLQAEGELDENWTLMKSGLSGVPSMGTWLTTNLPANSRVGVDPRIYTYTEFTSLQSTLQAAGHTLVPVATNLVEVIWTDRPKRPTNLVVPLELEFTGRNISDKLAEVLTRMTARNAKYLVLTALDQIAWFLNLRGSDITYNPVFFSYVIVNSNGTFTLFINPEQLSDEVTQHLTSEAGDVFQIRSYDDIEETLRDISENTDDQVWFSRFASYAITASLFQLSQLIFATPAPELMKAVKNQVEIEGLRNAHIKDAVALCQYFAWLEKNVASGNITEISGANKLYEFRQQQEHFITDSFETISASGINAAIIHYAPTSESDIPITNTDMYLCDSGAQFKDGTTDVTRTMHFGTPTDWEKETYTRVLKGQLKMGNAVFASGLTGSQLDSWAREFLWEVGLDYAHGTGHGIGAYLMVHEGPFGISYGYIQDDPGLQAGMFVSNEPGYYEDGYFGIRIEDIVEFVVADTPHNFNNKGYLTFKTITLVPKQTKLIKIELMTDKEIEILNNYHQEIRDVIGPILESQGDTEAKEWLWRETERISNSALRRLGGAGFLLVAMIIRNVLNKFVC